MKSPAHGSGLQENPAPTLAFRKRHASQSGARPPPKADSDAFNPAYSRTSMPPKKRRPKQPFRTWRF
jgi:hypothetical protein